MATISDKKQLALVAPCMIQGIDGACMAYGTPEVQDYFGADVVTATDYYPFGMPMPGRKYSDGDSYRYGFNGQEKSNELNEAFTTAKYWEYDSRIGRRWNEDPKPTLGVSNYSVFLDNPIWHIDILGDSVGPERTEGFKVYVVNKTRDEIGTRLSYNKYKKEYDKDPTHTILIETDKLDKKTADDIKAKLGKNGYIQLLALDYHRHVYQEMPQSDKNDFYKGLSKGYTGYVTQVLLGMCWSGGGPGFRDKEHLDLTLDVSQLLDKATVYGLKTEANNGSFYLFGDFGYFNPVYLLTPWNRVSKSEMKNISTWTISSYSPQLETYSSKTVTETIQFNNGKLNIIPFYITTMSGDLPPVWQFP